MSCAIAAALLSMGLLSQTAAAEPRSEAAGDPQVTNPAAQTVTVPIPEGHAAKPPVIDPEAEAILEREQGLAAAAAVVHQRRTQQEPTYASYSGMTADSENQRLVVHWKGTPPTEVKELTAELAGLHDISIDLRAAPFTREQLEQGARELMDQPSRQNTALTMAAPLEDGTGLRVWQDNSATGTAVRPSAPSAATDAPSGSATSEHNLPTQFPVVVETDGAEPLAATRYNDSIPLWGGARITAGNSCTTAFAVWRADLGQRTTSAAHCGPKNWRTGGGNPVGPSIIMVPGIDTQIIDAPALPGMWHGQVTSTGAPGPDETFLRVSALHRPVAGLHVNSSGSFSGTRSAILTVQTGIVLEIPGFGLIHEQVMGHQATRGPAVGNGDSGGPMFRYAPDNRVEAAGIITAIDLNTEVACTGVPTGVNDRKCAWRMFYTDFSESLRVTSTLLVVSD